VDAHTLPEARLAIRLAPISLSSGDLLARLRVSNITALTFANAVAKPAWRTAGAGFTSIFLAPFLRGNEMRVNKRRRKFPVCRVCGGALPSGNHSGYCGKGCRLEAREQRKEVLLAQEQSYSEWTEVHLNLEPTHKGEQNDIAKKSQFLG
jgi:hypothetical protein